MTVGRYENPEGTYLLSSIVVGIICPLVEIRSTHLSKSGVNSADQINSAKIKGNGTSKKNMPSVNVL